MTRRAFPARSRSAWWAAAGVAVCAGVVALASRGPLGSSSPVQGSALRAPVEAGILLVLGCGVLTLAGLVVIVWPGRRARDELEPERGLDPAQMHWLWKLVAAAVPLLLGAAVVAAAVLGVRGHPAGTRTQGSGLGGTGPPAPVTSQRGHQGFVLPGWLGWTLLAIVAAALALGAIWLITRRLATRSEDRAAPSVVEAAVRAAEAALESIADPRAAVIAAYGAMELTFAQRGVPRPAAEAPREYLRRLLRLSAATESTASTLTALFEEARFSDHPMSERERALALRALASLREGTADVQAGVDGERRRSA